MMRAFTASGNSAMNSSPNRHLPVRGGRDLPGDAPPGSRPTGENGRDRIDVLHAGPHKTLSSTIISDARNHDIKDRRGQQQGQGPGSDGLRVRVRVQDISSHRYNSSNQRPSVLAATSHRGKKKCAKCNLKAEGDLRFPCGRMVQLCLACAQAFSDLLAKRIVEIKRQETDVKKAAEVEDDNEVAKAPMAPSPSNPHSRPASSTRARTPAPVSTSQLGGDDVLLGSGNLTLGVGLAGVSMNVKPATPGTRSLQSSPVGRTSTARGSPNRLSWHGGSASSSPSGSVLWGFAGSPANDLSPSGGVSAGGNGGGAQRSLLLQAPRSRSGNSASLFRAPRHTGSSHIVPPTNPRARLERRDTTLAMAAKIGQESNRSISLDETNSWATRSRSN